MKTSSQVSVLLPLAEFVTAYGPKKRVALDNFEESRTKQSFKEECDINNIMRKYEATGLVDFVSQYQPQYGDVTGIDFQNSMNIVAQATEMFEALPAKTRDLFENNVAAFVDFVSNPENDAKAVEMGLKAAQPGQATPTPTPNAAAKGDPSTPVSDPSGGEGA